MQIIATIVRHGLTIFAGSLIADGTLTEVDIETVSAAVLTVGVIVWSIAEKKYFTKKA